jgi:hypothetical protein
MCPYMNQKLYDAKRTLLVSASSCRRPRHSLQTARHLCLPKPTPTRINQSPTSLFDIYLPVNPDIPSYHISSRQATIITHIPPSYLCRDPSTILHHAIHTPLPPSPSRPVCARSGRVFLHASGRPQPVLVYQYRRGPVSWSTTKDFHGMWLLSTTVSFLSRPFTLSFSPSLSCTELTK